MGNGLRVIVSGGVLVTLALIVGIGVHLHHVEQVKTQQRATIKAEIAKITFEKSQADKDLEAAKQAYRVLNAAFDSAYAAGQARHDEGSRTNPDIQNMFSDADQEFQAVASLSQLGETLVSADLKLADDYAVILGDGASAQYRKDVQERQIQFGFAANAWYQAIQPIRDGLKSRADGQYSFVADESHYYQQSADAITRATALTESMSHDMHALIQKTNDLLKQRQDALAAVH